MSIITDAIAPYRLWIEIAFLVAVAGGVTVAVHHYGNKRFAAGQAEVTARWDHEKAAQQAVAIKAQADAAAETERRLKAQQEATHDHETALAAARAESAAANDSVVRLRKSIAALSARSSGPAGNPAAAAVSAPAARVGTVASEAVAAYSELADAARLGQLAGNECSARYDALGAKR